MITRKQMFNFVWKDFDMILLNENLARKKLTFSPDLFTSCASLCRSVRYSVLELSVQILDIFRYVLILSPAEGHKYVGRKTMKTSGSYI